MILKRLILENYCLFEGLHEFDLEPRTKYRPIRPIVLFGGKNGAGKTTFLSAIQLAFYGRQSVGERLSEKDYHFNLRNRIHRNNQTDRRASLAKVGLIFDLVVQGEKNEYAIERSWISEEDSKLIEFFKVKKNGRYIEDVSDDHLQSFIADIVPERLSQLFFFDGEKIKNIAEDMTSNAAIADAIQTLLGLDVVKSLQTDLNVFRTRILKTSDPKAYNRQLATADTELAHLKEEQARLFIDELHLSEIVEGFKLDISRLEKQLSQQGGTFAQSREANNNLEGELENRRSTLISEIRDACDSSLPFALCPNINRLLSRELEAEDKLRRHLLIDNEISILHAKLMASALKRLSGSSRNDLVKFLTDEMTQYREAQYLSSDITERHALSESDAALTVEALTQHAPAAAKRIHISLIELDKIDRKLDVVRKDLEKTPDHFVLQDAFSELKVRLQDLGRAEEVKHKITESLRTTENALAAKKREKVKLEASLGVAHHVVQKTKLIQKLNRALDAYMSRLTKAKIAQLQSEITECFNRLAHKADFVRRIEINPNDFSVAVIDKFERSIPKENLSSGEKQIFAISMLWGLARTSGRPLPVVIDTPLGRLDSDHRQNLIRNYFPFASHQVILLSTDTEVDVNSFKELSPAVSHCYHLKYDQEKACTTVDNEYFWLETIAA